jgi:membrane peptidoglycan carboxypeptidase
MLAAIRSWSDRRCAANAAEFARRWSGVIAIPDYFLQLLILIEDKRFPKHYGVDPIGVVRAVVHNVLKRGMRQGASTLPQQLYNLRFARKYGKRYSGSIAAKLVQVAFGIWITFRLSKETILSEYLQGVYWGKSFQGIDEAAQGYLGKVRQDLSVEESFFLIERLCSPNRRSSRRVEAILRRAPIVDILTANHSSVGLLKLFYEQVHSVSRNQAGQVSGIRDKDCAAPNSSLIPTLGQDQCL